MRDNGHFISILLPVLFLTSACERTGLSPVEIKIDDGSGAPSATAAANEPREPIVVESAAVENDAAEKDSPGAAAKDPEASTKNYEERKRKEQLDAEFAGVVASGGKDASAKKGKKNASAADASSNKQEDVLSSPKIIKTASGSDIKGSEKKKEEAKEVPSAPKAGEMAYPIKGKIISQFGDVKDGIANDGVNIKSGAGTPVKASADGTVLYAGNKLEEEFGNVVIVQHKNDLITSYAHLGEIKVKKDAKVKAGDVLGTVGSSGDVTEPQLHFEVMKDKIPVNPMKYLPKEAEIKAKVRR
ncbi:MAG: M23 family metallopeptidase [Holosporaceae bacterium]|jgi:murein DD-endopeptidase MepM/ murein hydrolase activator NlpD|nr:M23 family metallopeptidase [Holosporaceae bacterium]